MIRRWWRQLIGGTPPPEGFDGPLDRNERVLGSAATAGGGYLVATTLGLWLPQDEGGYRRVGWHLVSKATWDGRALTIIEADEVGTEGDAVLITDRPPQRLPLAEPGSIPELVHARVTRSVLHSEHRQDADRRELRVQRRVPGRDGIQVQIRREP